MLADKSVFFFAEWPACPVRRQKEKTDLATIAYYSIADNHLTIPV